MSKRSVLVTGGAGYVGSHVAYPLIEAGRRLTAHKGARRAGDPPALVADNRGVRDDFKWRPRHDRLDDIVGSAWAWERKFAIKGAAA